MSDIVRVHHLDCCTMCPRIGRINDQRRFVGHVLALETASSGLVLVDTGLGLAVRARPVSAGRGFAVLFRPDTDPAGTAIRQLEALGFSAGDVRHIVITHLDADHAGGLADFPAATVHLHRRELEAARARRHIKERSRYLPGLWAHGPNFLTYEQTGEPWFGFDAVHDLDGLPAGILAVPLPGHTRGHSAVAVEGPDGWMLHCGDGYFHQAVVDPTVEWPAANRRFERVVAMDHRRVLANHDRLRELAVGHAEIAVFSAHDPVEFTRFTTA